MGAPENPHWLLFPWASLCAELEPRIAAKRPSSNGHRFNLKWSQVSTRGKCKLQKIKSSSSHCNSPVCFVPKIYFPAHTASIFHFSREVHIQTAALGAIMTSGLHHICVKLKEHIRVGDYRLLPRKALSHVVFLFGIIGYFSFLTWAIAGWLELLCVCVLNFSSVCKHPDLNYT